MAKSIEQLDSGEAIYTLYRATEAYGHSLDLDDEEQVIDVVRAAFAEAVVAKVSSLGLEVERPATSRRCWPTSWVAARPWCWSRRLCSRSVTPASAARRRSIWPKEETS